MKKSSLFQTFHLLRLNAGVFLQFELLFKLLCLIVAGPIALLLIRLSMIITDYRCLTAENLAAYLLHPVTVLVLLLILLSIAVVSAFDMSAVICIMDASQEGEKVKVKSVIRYAVRNTGNLFRRRGRSMLLFVLLATVAANIGTVTGLLTSLSLLGRLLSLCQSVPLLAGLFVLLLAVQIFFSVRWLYCFHYFTLENCSFREARVRNRGLQGRCWKQDLLSMLLIQALCLLAYYVAAALLVYLIILFANLTGETMVVRSIVLGIIAVGMSLLLLLLLGISLPVSVACVSVLFYRHKEDAEEAIYHTERDFRSARLFKSRKTAVGVSCLIGAAVLSMGINTLISQRLNFNVDYLTPPEVTAHRGASADCPENTMAAFVAAEEAGADWIELDVQLTKDGVPVILHDSNLRRTTGVNRNIWTVSYEELRDLDNGSWFAPEFSDQRIPTLEEVLAFAAEKDIRLNIELKPTGHEENFEEIVVDAILAQDMQYQCVVTSQVYSVLRNIKEYNEEIYTVYVMKMAAGDITRLQYADAFSVNTTFVTNQLVTNVHNHGQEIYAWTVNTRRNLDKVIRLNVDNIVTDRVELAKTAILESKASNFILEYVSFVMEFFAV